MIVHGALPPGVTCYRSTPPFTHDTVPPKLLAAHNVKAGVWGLLHVTRGSLRYCIAAPPSSHVVREGRAAVIEPEVRHHVELLDPDTSFYIAFYREETAAPPAGG